MTKNEAESVIFSCKAVGCRNEMRCQHRTSWKRCTCVGLQNNFIYLFAHVSRIVFVLDYQQTRKKVELTKRPFFVDFTIIVLTQQICILELSNQVLKLVCFKDLE